MHQAGSSALKLNKDAFKFTSFTRICSFDMSMTPKRGCASVGSVTMWATCSGRDASPWMTTRAPSWNARAEAAAAGRPRVLRLLHLRGRRGVRPSVVEVHVVILPLLFGELRSQRCSCRRTPGALSPPPCGLSGSGTWRASLGCVDLVRGSAPPRNASARFLGSPGLPSSLLPSAAGPPLGLCRLRGFRRAGLLGGSGLVKEGEGCPLQSLGGPQQPQSLRRSCLGCQAGCRVCRGRGASDSFLRAPRQCERRHVTAACARSYKSKAPRPEPE